MPNTPSVVSHMCDMRRENDAPLCEISSGRYGPNSAYDDEQHGQHGHRRADRAPGGLEQQHEAGDRHDEVERRRLSGPQRERVVEEHQVRRREGAGDGEDPVLPSERGRAASASNAGHARKARNSANARCSERASVSLRTKKRSANGSGDAYQVWNSAHASATPKMTFAVTPGGLRRRCRPRRRAAAARREPSRCRWSRKGPPSLPRSLPPSG